ncbi:MAG: sporulation protein YqfD [Bacilli bacterium]
MENKYLKRLDKIVKIKVSGRNVYRFIDRLIKDKVYIYDLKIINIKNVIIKINYDDYLILKDKKSIYDIDLLDVYGKLKIKKYFKEHYVFIIFLIIGYVVLMFLSNFIFDIEVVHANFEIRELVYRELRKNGIEKYIFRKSYQELENIEKNILDNNKTKIEWIEINRSGTKYIVRVEERKIDKGEERFEYQDIVSSKSGIITKVLAESGEIIKNTNDYIKGGEVVISGNITLPDGSSVLSRASGKVYAEVWYLVDVSYPYIYREEILTGRAKEVFLIKFLNKRISLFDFSKFNTFKKSDRILFGDIFKFFSFIKEKQYEMIVIDEFYTKEEVVVKAVERAVTRVKDTLREDEQIIKYRILSTYYDESKVNLKIFFSVNEEVSEVRKIDNNEVEDS